jgi:hypothetical protein
VITVDDIRRFVTAFPEVKEFAHFRPPAFKVRGKPVAGVEKGAATAVFSISQDEAATAVVDDPATYEEVWRTAATKSFVGLRVDLAKVLEERIQELVEHAWRNKDPKRWWPLTTLNEGGGGETRPPPSGGEWTASRPIRSRILYRDGPSRRRAPGRCSPTTRAIYGSPPRRAPSRPVRGRPQSRSPRR